MTVRLLDYYLVEVLELMYMVEVLEVEDWCVARFLLIQVKWPV